MKVLLVGGGGREHALAWKIAQSPRVKTLFAAPGNVGMRDVAELVDLSAEDINGVLQFAKRESIDLVVVGPEDPLCMGMVDILSAEGIRAFGPCKAAARLEGDKSFAKEMMQHQSIPTAEARVFTQFRDAKTYVASRDCGMVVKAAGLAKGKGAIVCADPAEAILSLELIMVDREFGNAGDRVVIEEKLNGPEVSVLAFVDGQTIYVMEIAQDHKPIGEGDTGPNTGGMGDYGAAPVADGRLRDTVTVDILVRIVHALAREHVDYRGVVYAGLMVTRGGPRVIEFNCRFGDPEAQAIVPRLRSDIVPLLAACADGRLAQAPDLDWDPRPAVCVVLASRGYPASSSKGDVIHGLDAVRELPDVHVFHAGTAREGDHVVTAGGRVLGVTALGDTVEQARERAYAAVERISFDGMQYRRDIASRALGR